MSSSKTSDTTVRVSLAELEKQGVQTDWTGVDAAGDEPIAQWRQ